MKDMHEVTAAGVAAQAALDKHLAAAYKAALKLTKVTERGVELGMVTKAIAAKTIIADARSLPGQIATVAAFAARLHAEQTKVCQANDCDTPSPDSVGGVVVFGGGGR